MELRQLRYFVKVAEALNFSEAAKTLCVTQSTLSQQIKQIEGELSTPLLIRDSHSVKLTEAGTELLPYARRTIKDADMCAARINDLNQLAVGELSIGVTYSFSPILTETVLEFIKEYPSIKLNIFYKPMQELLEMLGRREVDFVLAFRPNDAPSDMESHILFQNALAAVMRSDHPLAAKKKITLTELEQYDMALPAKGLQARNAFDSVTTPYNKFKIRLELNEVNILLKIVSSSNLVTVLAEDSIYNAHGVKAVPLDIPDNEMTGCVHVLKDTYHKQSMKEFVRLLSESIAVKVRQNGWLT